LLLVDTMLSLNQQKQTITNSETLERLNQRIAYTDDKINNLVYELYGLSEEEVRIVEGKGLILQWRKTDEYRHCEKFSSGKFVVKKDFQENFVAILRIMLSMRLPRRRKSVFNSMLYQGGSQWRKNTTPLPAALILRNVSGTGTFRLWTQRKLREILMGN